MKVIHDDCLEVMKGMEENSVDAVVCDPPYGLFFMGRSWDKGTPPIPFWQEALRVAKPGAYLLAFGGTRTHHRLMCAIEDAGWILRDTLSWNYGSGFPKSKNIALAIDKGQGHPNRGRAVPTASHFQNASTKHLTGNPVPPYEARSEAAKPWKGWGTALKPAWEPLVLAQKPLGGAMVSELFRITKRRRWHTKRPKESWEGKPDEKSWQNSHCYKLCREHGLQWWERETEEGRVERWIFERKWLALDPKARGRHVIIGRGKRIVLSRFPYKDKLVKGVAANVLKWKCGALNIGACRIGRETIAAHKGTARNKIYGKFNEPYSPGDAGKYTQSKGRWPANFLLSHSVFCEKVGEREVEGYAINRFKDGAKPFGGGAGHPYESQKQGKQVEEDWRCVPDCPVRMLDEQSGESKSGKRGLHKRDGKTNIYGGNALLKSATKHTGTVEYGDKGSASRFFYTAKASRSERNAGLSAEHNLFMKREAKKSDHPTMKPIAVMRYLCRLVTPPNGRILDPFAGSGSTGCAAALEDFEFIGVEKEAGYVEIARARIKHWEAQSKRG